MEASSLSLEERFRQALDSCDASYARVDQTPVVTEHRPRPSPPLPPLAGPAPISARPPEVAAPTPPGLQDGAWAGREGGREPPLAVTVAAPGNGAGTLKAIAIAVGVLLLVAAGWFVRSRLVLPFFERRRRRAKDSGGDEEEIEDEEAPTPGLLARLRRGRGAAAAGAAADRYRPPAALPPKRVQFQEPRGKAPARGGGRLAAPTAAPKMSMALSVEKQRAALQAAQSAAAASAAAKRAAFLSREAVEEGEDDSDEAAAAAAGVVAEEPVDPNFVEL
jgi:hypothetical protein